MVGYIEGALHAKADGKVSFVTRGKYNRKFVEVEATEQQ